MAYKIQFENGHTIEFDSQPSESDIDEAFAHTQSLPPPTQAAANVSQIPGGAGADQYAAPTPEPSFLDKLTGAAEAGAQVVSGLPGMVVGPLMGIQAASRGASPKEAEEAAARQMEAMTYAPRTPAGEEYAGKVGEVINKYLMPIAPLAHLPSIKAREGVAASRAMLPEQAMVKPSGNLTLRALQEAQAAREAAKAPVEAPKPPETLYADEKGVITPELPTTAERLAKERADRVTVGEPAKEPIQAELFAPQTNVYRPYTDIRAATEAGGERPLTHTEFDQVHENLAKEPATAHEMPKDMDAAYQKYTEQVSGKQADMFDIGSRQEAFGQLAFKEQVARQLEEHPFVKKAEKELAKQEQFVSDLREQVATGETTTAALATEVKALEKAQENVATVRTNVETALTKKQKPVPFNIRTRKQGGGLFLGERKEQAKIENSLTEQKDVQIPENPKTLEVLDKALKEGKDGHLWTYMQSGATSAAMKTGSAAIKAASEIIQNGIKRGEQSIRAYVFPAEHSLRKLSKEELTTLKDVFMEEGKTGKRFDADLLENTLSIKQLEAYVNMRNMFDDTLAAQNAARVAKGQKPVTPNEAYMASRWNGDFRRPIYNKEGKLVWYLASNSKMGLDFQSKNLLKEFPDLIVDTKKDHVVRSATGKTDLQSMYTTMLDLLGRDDPAVAKIKAAIEDQTSAEAQATLAQEKHFEKKAGIRGFVGERPGHGGTTEALAMFQQQIQYAKNAYKWSEMQKAADDIKSIVSDERLQEQQPNNVKYVREYFKNAIGHGESAVMRQLEDSVRSGLGVSPKVVNEAVGGLKSVFILQKLAVSAGYTMANMVQASNVLPYLADLRAKGYKGNPAIAMAVGVPGGLAMTASHYLKSIGGDYISLMPNQFFKDAFQYAENNGVTSRSIYDEGPLAGSFGGVSRVGELLGKTMTAPEVMVRSVAFMSYAQMLKDSKKFTDQNKMFQLAEEYVNKSMVDYRETERPLIFSKMGGAGNFLNTLQTYPMSFYNQYAYMAHEAFKNKNPTPLITSLALQGLIAGAMGVPYTEDAYKLFMTIKDNLVGTETWAKMKDSPLLSDPKLWMMETLGKGSVYGVLSENTGLGLTSRVAAPGVGAMLQSPIGPAVDLAKQAGALGSALIDPTNPQKWAQSAMKSIPTGLQGLLETSGIMKDHTYVEREDGSKVFMKTTDLAAREGKYARTPEEISMRKWGLRSQKEVAESDIAYATEHADQVLKKKSGPLVGEYYNALRNGDTKKASTLSKLYIELTGKEISDPQTEAELKKEFTTKSERILLKGGTPAEIVNAARMQKLLNTEFTP